MNVTLSPPRRGFLTAPPPTKTRLKLLVKQQGAMPGLTMRPEDVENHIRHKKLSVSPGRRKLRPSPEGGSSSQKKKYLSSPSRLSRVFQKGRHVRFQSDSLGADIVTELGPTKKLLDFKEIEATWYSRLELRQCRMRAQDTVRYFLECRPDFRQAAYRMLERCGARKHLLMEDNEDVIIGMSEEDDMQTLHSVESRGLEKRLINHMQLPYFRHKRSIQIVIDTQEKLRSTEIGFFNVVQRTRVISSQYINANRYASCWARKFASYDEHSAQWKMDEE